VAFIQEVLPVIMNSFDLLTATTTTTQKPSVISALFDDDLASTKVSTSSRVGHEADEPLKTVPMSLFSNLDDQHCPHTSTSRINNDHLKNCADNKNYHSDKHDKVSPVPLESQLLVSRHSNNDEVPLHQLISKDYPETNEDCELVDEYLASEMSRLSVEERERRLFELHGLRVVNRDRPSVEKALAQLDVELQKITHRRQPFEQAKYHHASYVNDRNFRLMFLRCSESFDSKSAAQKIISHFDVKQSLFGNGEILGRDVLLSDLSADDIATLEAGMIQILPTKDTSGRTIVIIFPQLRNESWNAKGFLRGWFYIVMTIARSVENQRKGWVTVLFNVGCHLSPWGSFPLIRAYRRHQHGVPRHVTGVHMCYNEPTLRPFVLTQKLFIFNSNLRSRMIEHYGDVSHCLFELQAYGVCINDSTHGQLVLPDGSISLRGHQTWLQDRKRMEQSASPVGGFYLSGDCATIVPTRFDVLHGRGSKITKHTGNLRLMHVCTMKLESYSAANKYQKVRNRKSPF
jgi:hypothetical protein